MKLGDHIVFDAIREDLEKVRCDGEVIEFGSDGPVVRVVSPLSRFESLLKLQLLARSIVGDSGQLRYAGTYHGGIFVPGIFWKS